MKDRVLRKTNFEWEQTGVQLEDLDSDQNSYVEPKATLHFHLLRGLQEYDVIEWESL